MANQPSAHGERQGNNPESAFGEVLRKTRRMRWLSKNGKHVLLQRAPGARSLSQEALGAQAGYHRTYISQLERGEKSPSLRTIFDLAKTLLVSPTKLVGDTEKLHYKDR